MLVSCTSPCTFSISVTQMVKQDNCYQRQLLLLSLKMQLPLQLFHKVLWDCWRSLSYKLLQNSCKCHKSKFRWLMLLVHVLKVCLRKWPVSNWTKRQRAWTLKDTWVCQALHKDHGSECCVLAQHCCTLAHEMITIMGGNKEIKACCEGWEETWEREVLTDACCKSIGCRFLKYKPNWWRDNKRTVLLL